MKISQELNISLAGEIFLKQRFPNCAHSVQAYTPQAYKAHACPASRLKRNPRVNKGNISGLIDGGIYLSEARSRRDILPCVVHSRQDVVVVFTFQGWGLLSVMGGTNFRWAYQLPGKPAEAYFSAIILIRTITRWSLQPVWRKASHVLKIQMKQTLVQLGMYRKQESNHLD